MEAMSNFQIDDHDDDRSEGARRWIERLDAIIDSNIGDHTFDNERLAREMGVSERNLFRKVNELLGMPPQKYLRKRRMNRAMEHLSTGEYRTVNETAYAIGYLNVSYFISQFEKEFNTKPLQVLQNFGWR